MVTGASLGNTESVTWDITDIIDSSFVSRQDTYPAARVSASAANGKNRTAVLDPLALRSAQPFVWI